MYYLVIDPFGPLGGLAGGTDTTDGHLATRPWEVLTVPVMPLSSLVHSVLRTAFCLRPVGKSYYT